MSRSRKAIVTAAFAYGQTAAGVILSLLVTRFVLHRIGESLYGLWLASGALLAYAALADLGIFGVLPWLVAEADGKKDIQAMRGLVMHGCAAGLCVGSAYVVVALVLWTAFPSVLHLSDADRAKLFGPLALMVVATFVSYPLRVFVALQAGLQEVFFSGGMAVTQLLLSNALIFTLTWRGYGLYGVAAGAALPPVLSGAAALARTLHRRRELLREWPKLEWQRARPILTGGAGAWMGSMGWQLAFSSDAIVIGYLGKPELITVFAISGRVGQMLMQLGWTLPDSTLVGLAQLAAEGAKKRVKEVVTVLLRFHLVTAGAVGCAVLAVNPGVVRLWVGEKLFGGFTLNGMFVADILILSVGHALMSICSVLGNRPKVGLMTLANGALHAALAVPLGATLGLNGIALATFVSALVTTVPAGFGWVAEVAGVPSREYLGHLARWSLRAAPALAFAAFAGRVTAQSSLPVLTLTGAVVSIAYALACRPIMREMPLPATVRRVMTLARLV